MARNNHPSVNYTEKQMRSAEQMLGGMEVSTFIERRASGNYWQGELTRRGNPTATITVKALAPLKDYSKECVLLCEQPIDALDCAELVVDKGMTTLIFKGRVDASRPGRRDQDFNQRTPVHVAQFYVQRH
ncbi:MAG: hypothetical protein F6K31_40580 [Symploca sp. SIO2G7]|nr:hypothetical protein [Symploca sp. SIO2G7]